MSVHFFRLLPSIQKGEGSGHSRRCHQLEQELTDSGVRVLSGEQYLTENPDTTLDSTTSTGLLSIVDQRGATNFFVKSLAEDSTPLLLDDDGPARYKAPYILDIIPGPRSSEANLFEPRFMNLPIRNREPDAAGSILVSFGGEDPAGLTATVLDGLVKVRGSAEGLSCTLPPGNGDDRLPDGISLLSAPENLKDHLSNYGMVICSYGLTAWEALAAGCAVLTVDPSPYHAMLSMDAGFPGLGHVLPRRQLLSSPDYRSLAKLLSNPEKLNIGAEELFGKWFKDALHEESSAGNALFVGSGVVGLAGFLRSLDTPSPHCAACRETLPPVISRFPYRSYYRCPACGMIGMYRFRLKEDEYGPAYFQQEYQAQYGRSYLDDFETIKAMGVRRLIEINRKAKNGGSLLDIGCAFGPFLKAASEAGYNPFGSDVSAEGTAYVRDVLKIPAVQGGFPADNPAEALGQPGFDVVSLWYVIEHFENLHEVLDLLSQLVNPEGVLALSTPNGSGISGRLSLRQFLKNSPVDHYTIWTPKNARRLLAQHGFRIYRIRVTGHHPERFTGNPSQNRFVFRVFELISRVFGLGDTFEIYAIREPRIGE